LLHTHSHTHTLTHSHRLPWAICLPNSPLPRSRRRTRALRPCTNRYAHTRTHTHSGMCRHVLDMHYSILHLAHSHHTIPSIISNYTPHITPYTTHSTPHHTSHHTPLTLHHTTYHTKCDSHYTPYTTTLYHSTLHTTHIHLTPHPTPLSSSKSLTRPLSPSST
jgi:hypothetical protein